jgi:hypothetical protein
VKLEILSPKHQIPIEKSWLYIHPLVNRNRGSASIRWLQGIVTPMGSSKKLWGEQLAGLVRSHRRHDWFFQLTEPNLSIKTASAETDCCL